jgi:hypothetical protein
VTLFFSKFFGVPSDGRCDGSFTEVRVFIVVVTLRRDDITGVPTPVARRTGPAGR